MEKEINISPVRLGKRDDKVKEIPESLVRPPTTGTSGGTSSKKKQRPRSSIHFGGTQGRFGGPSSARREQRNKSAADRNEAQRKEIEQEKIKKAN